MSQSVRFRFGFDFRVRYDEVDAQQIVHNTKYLLYFELGRVEYLRHLEFAYHQILDLGYEFMLVQAHVEYRQPAVFDQLLHLKVTINWVKKSSFQFCYQLVDKHEGNVIAEGYTTHVTLDPKTMKSSSFPDTLKVKVTEFEQRNLIKATS